MKAYKKPKYKLSIEHLVSTKNIFCDSNLQIPPCLKKQPSLVSGNNEVISFFFFFFTFLTTNYFFLFLIYIYFLNNILNLLHVSTKR